MTDIDFSTCYTLSHKELFSFDKRIERGDWLQKQLPTGDLYFVQDAPLTLPLFQEAVMCFVNGQFIACVVLGFSVVERSLAARLHAIEKDIPWNAEGLLKAAKNQGWLDEDEFKLLDKAREYRNPVTHFRDIIDPSRPDMRAHPFGKNIYDVLEQDAKHVLSAAIAVLNKTSI